MPAGIFSHKLVCLSLIKLMLWIRCIQFNAGSYKAEIADYIIQTDGWYINPQVTNHEVTLWQWWNRALVDRDNHKKCEDKNLWKTNRKTSFDFHHESTWYMTFVHMRYLKNKEQNFPILKKVKIGMLQPFDKSHNIVPNI